MQIKDSSEESQVPVIICTNQILRLLRKETFSLENSKLMN